MQQCDRKMKSHSIVCSSGHFVASPQDSSPGDRARETQAKMGQFLHALSQTVGAQSNMDLRPQATKCHTEDGASSFLMGLQCGSGSGGLRHRGWCRGEGCQILDALYVLR